MSEPLRFTLPVTVGRISMHVDRSVSVTVRSTMEIGDDDFSIIHKAFQRVGWFLFSENRLGDSDVPKEDVDVDIKSQSQIIRNKCYRLFRLKLEAGEDVDFDVLYRQVTNSLIGRLDARIAEYD